MPTPTNSEIQAEALARSLADSLGYPLAGTEAKDQTKDQTCDQVPGPSTSLDPDDWTALRSQGHKMLDDMFDHLQSLRQQPVWQPAPPATRARFRAPLPLQATPLENVHNQFLSDILPYGSGNTHPGFMGWVQGGGTAVGMLAELLAAGVNANLGGRDHMAICVEQQITHWMRDIFQFPNTAQGLFLTGASQANFVAVLLARHRAEGKALQPGSHLKGYTSKAAHGCIPRAMDMAGIGADNLRMIDTNPDGQLDIASLKTAIHHDRSQGHVPFLLVGTAGTVNTGSIDNLSALASVARQESLHFHIDGALGALAVLSPELAPLFAGISECDSLAFDFHTWGQVPYDAGFLLTRNDVDQKAVFASEAAYLTRAEQGLAAGETWPCDYGPDLSRGFRALKTWFTLKTYGLDALGASMAANCRLARALGERIDREPGLERLAPVALNIVCFGVKAANSDDLNSRIIESLHLEGRVAPSLTLIGGRKAIRAALVNHRTTQSDIDALVDHVLAFANLT